MTTGHVAASTEGSVTSNEGFSGNAPAAPHPALTPEVRARLVAEMQEIIARYPRPRSALLPMLHLMQAEQGYVSSEGIELCAEVLDLTTAEVSGVATFYTQYKRHPVGDYSVGVCTNTLCAVMGGDAIFQTLKDHLGVGHDETTPDRRITLERVECNAACDYAPVVMVNWEFFDNQTPQSAVDLVDRLRAAGNDGGQLPRPTRGASLCTFREVSRVLAGFPDGRAHEGVGAGPATLVGLQFARERGDDPFESTRGAGPGATSAAGGAAATEGTGYGKSGGPSGSDAGAQTSASDRANPQPAGAADESSDTERGDGGTAKASATEGSNTATTRGTSKEGSA
jgi:NADH-quinone oxidoreductase subunit E